MKIPLDVSLDKKDFDIFLDRYHFSKGDIDDVKSLYKAINPLIAAEAFYSMDNSNIDVAIDDFATCFITLGFGIDSIQDVYIEQELVMESYIIDCLASELLSKAYTAFIDLFEKKTGKFVSKIDFLGDKYPIELVEKIYQNIKPEKIKYNKSFQLIPSKTVSMLLSLSNSKSNFDVCNTCATCKNRDCSMRKEPYVVNVGQNTSTYGYMAIFGA
ncbi:MAG: hypothetical protein UH211_00440 [Agathobacter sp.]|nr:hypothetical protein [Agathobacter sp.]